jgi:S-formylglutathione hydrolase FrmB
VSLIIIDALEVDDVGRHLSNLSRGACSHRQLLRGAVNAVASAEVVVFVGDDAAVTAAAIATATAQVEPSTSSSLPNLWKLSGWRSNGAVSTAGATVGGFDARDVVGSVPHRRSCNWPSSLLVRRTSFSNLRHLANSSFLLSLLLVPDWLARTLLMAQAPSMWRDSLSRGAQRRTPPLLPRRRLGLHM